MRAQRYRVEEAGASRYSPPLMHMYASTHMPEHDPTPPAYFNAEGSENDWALTLLFGGFHPAWYDANRPWMRATLEYELRHGGSVLEETRGFLDALGVASKLRDEDWRRIRRRPAAVHLRATITEGRAWAAYRLREITPALQRGAQQKIGYARQVSFASAQLLHPAPHLAPYGRTLFRAAREEVSAGEYYLRSRTALRATAADWVDDLSSTALALAAATRMDLINVLPSEAPDLLRSILATAKSPTER